MKKLNEILLYIINGSEFGLLLIEYVVRFVGFILGFTLVLCNGFYFYRIYDDKVFRDRQFSELQLHPETAYFIYLILMLYLFSILSLVGTRKFKELNKLIKENWEKHF